jgi:glutamate carboxypeptidase
VKPAAAAEHGASTLEILEQVERHTARMVALLRDLVEIETPSLEPETLVPMFRRVTREFAERRYRTRLAAGRSTGGHLLAIPLDRTRCDPVQLIVGHVDTVWPTGTIEQRPAALEGERILGPGSYDMKAGIVQILFALQTLRELGVQPPASPVVVVNSDEEIGSRESGATIRRLSRIANRAFVLEPGLGPSGKLKTARKGLGRYTVTVKGIAAHAGLDPERGASAILELSNVIQRLFALNDHSRGITVNVGTIEGGLRPNVIAPESSAAVDVRVLRAEDAEAIDRAIRQLEATTEGTAVFVTGGFGRPPMERTQGNVTLFERARRIGAEMGLELEEATAGGGSDGNTTSQNTPTLDGLGANGDGAHAPGEHVMVPSLVQRTALLARLLVEPLDEVKPA